MSSPSVTGSFVQFAPRGPDQEGSFSITRPGRARFDYSPPSPLTVIADGMTVAVRNSKLGTWDLYPLAKTPMRLLLDGGIKAVEAVIASTAYEDGLLKVVLSDPAVFDRATVVVSFSPDGQDLRQWTVVDGRGDETTFVVFDLDFRTGAPAADYRIPYSDIRTIR